MNIKAVCSLHEDDSLATTMENDYANYLESDMNENKDGWISVPSFMYMAYRKHGAGEEYISNIRSLPPHECELVAKRVGEAFNERLKAEGASFKVQVRYYGKSGTIIYKIDSTNYTGEETDDLLDI